jgi:hypothetical protein
MKQRWRKTKNLKHSNCHSCGSHIMVIKNYKEEWCCNGIECGCYGYPINPVFCDECELKIFGNVMGSVNKGDDIK